MVFIPQYKNINHMGLVALYGNRVALCRVVYSSSDFLTFVNMVLIFFLSHRTIEYNVIVFGVKEIYDNYFLKCLLGVWVEQK